MYSPGYLTFACASSPENGNGFVFDGVDEGSLESSLTHALSVYRNERSKWEEISRKNMKSDFSWDQSAASYVDIYNSVAAF